MKKQGTFAIPKNQLYFCGHSLGPASTQTMNTLAQGMQGWMQERVNAWTTEEWIDLPLKLGHMIAPLIGAQSDEVIVADSTSVNLLKCLLVALSVNTGRKEILTEHENFPADRYIADSLTAMSKGITVKSVDAHELIDALDDSIAVLLLTHVNYRSAYKHDMAKLTQLAQQRGIIVIWDLSHSVGAMPLYLGKLGVDFAVGCTYKYLNGGPGAPGFIYVARKHQHIMPVVKGWMGHFQPFAFAQDYQRAPGIKAYLTGTPPILSLKALEGALALFQTVDLDQLRQRSITLSEQLIEKMAKRVPDFTLVSPRDPTLRGSHVAFTHPQAKEMAEALISEGLVVDYRNPGIIRFGISPLYLESEDIEQAIDCLEVLSGRFRVAR
ncbi:MAG: kynureninase [Candidatus Berkiella sp.]